MDIILNAVHDSDLIKYLTALGLYEEIIKGNIKCRFCNKVITIDNLLYLYPLNEKIVFSCDNPECYLKALKELKELKLLG
jgi:hypothetical protein